MRLGCAGPYSQVPSRATPLLLPPCRQPALAGVARLHPTAPDPACRLPASNPLLVILLLNTLLCYAVPVLLAPAVLTVRASSCSPPACACVEEGHQLIGLHVQQLVQVHATERELAVGGKRKHTACKQQQEAGQGQRRRNAGSSDQLPTLAGLLGACSCWLPGHCRSVHHRPPEEPWMLPVSMSCVLAELWASSSNSCTQGLQCCGNMPGLRPGPPSGLQIALPMHPSGGSRGQRLLRARLPIHQHTHRKVRFFAPSSAMVPVFSV